MNTYGYVFVAALLVGAGAALGWWVTDKDATAAIATLNNQHAQDLKAISDKAQQDTADAIAKMKTAQSDLAALSQTAQEKLTHAQTENDALRADVASGKRRVQFAKADLATCKRSATTVSGAGGVVDATTLELSADAGRNILDIRAGIISDQAKLDYLQSYIRILQKSGIIAAPSTQESKP